MGGDFAPINEVNGAIIAAEHLIDDTELEIIFVGNENKIRTAINQFEFSKLNYSILNAEEIVSMNDDPTEALKKKKNSSLYKGIEYLSQDMPTVLFLPAIPVLFFLLQRFFWEEYPV